MKNGLSSGYPTTKRLRQEKPLGSSTDFGRWTPDLEMSSVKSVDEIAPPEAHNLLDYLSVLREAPIAMELHPNLPVTSNVNQDFDLGPACRIP